MAGRFTREEVIGRAREKIEALFEGIACIRRTEVKQEVRGGTGPDFVVELFGNETRRLLLVEARTSGEPRHAREALNSLLLECSKWSDAAPVFAAPYISDAAAEICRQNSASYLDLAGNCHIEAGTFYIHTQGRQNPYKNKRRLKSISRPKASRIIRVLLNNPRRSWQTRELADEAGVSLGLVSNVKKILVDREWAEPEKRKIRLARPEELLAGWISAAEPPEPVYFFYSHSMDFIEIENSVSGCCHEKGARCAFTGLSAAVHMASGIDYYRQVQVLAEAEPEWIAAEAGLEKAVDKANVAVVKAGDTGMFYGARRVLPSSRLQYCRPSEKTVKTIEAEIRAPVYMVSAVQAYFDLAARFRGCGAEAEKLYKQVIEPSC